MDAVAEEAMWLERRGMSAAKAARWAKVNVIQGRTAKPHAIIERANPNPELWEEKHIDRSSYTNGNWTGD